MSPDTGALGERDTERDCERDLVIGPIGRSCGSDWLGLGMSRRRRFGMGDGVGMEGWELGGDNLISTANQPAGGSTLVA